MKPDWTLNMIPPRFFKSRTLVDAPLILYLVATILGVWVAYDRSQSWYLLGMIWISGGIYGLVSWKTGASLRGEWFLRLITLGGGVMSLFFIWGLSHHPPEDKVLILSTTIERLGRFLPPFPFWQPFPNSAAMFFEGLFFLGMGWGLFERARGWKIATGVATGWIGLALLVSQSRGAWVAMVLVSVLWLAWHYRAARWGLLGGIALLAFFLGLVLVRHDWQFLAQVPVVNETLVPLLMRPDRMEVYQGSISLLQDVPFTGIGLGGQFAMIYSRFVLLIQVPFLTYSHNLFLETWLETGILGLGAFVWMIFAVIWVALPALKARNDPWLEGAFAGWLAFLIHGVTDARPFVDAWCWFPFFLLAGLIVGRLKNLEPVSRSRTWIPFVFPVLFWGIMALVIPLDRATWDGNMGVLRYMRAELQPGVSEVERVNWKSQAERLLRDSVFRRENQRSAHFYLGMILEDEERFPEAVSEFEAAVRADPANPAIIKALGLAYTWNGQSVEAAQVLKQTARIEEELNTWAGWRSERGEKNLARNAYLVSLRIQPDQPEVMDALKRLSGN